MAKPPLDILVFTALVNRRLDDGTWTTAKTSDVKFEVSVDDGQTFQPATSVGIPGVPDFFRLPPTPRSLFYRVRAVPTSSKFWPVSAKFQLDASHFMARLLAFQEEQHFNEPGAWPMPIQTSIEDSSILQAIGIEHAHIIHHTVHLSRLRNSTQLALAAINKGRAIGFADDWLVSWLMIPPRDLRLGGNPPVGPDRKLRVEQQTVPVFMPTFETLILEIAGMPVPGALAVSWSSGVGRGPEDPTPFLVYLHPDLGQAASDYQGQPYPLGAVYLYWACFRDLTHQGDPLVQPTGSKGLVNQLAFARKAAVVVSPLPKLEGHVKEFKDAAVMEELLREVQAFFYHRIDSVVVPQLGRVALAAFSNAAGMHLKDFLQRGNSHQFVKEKLRELYLMDPRMNDTELVDAVLSWAKTDEQDKRVRVYLSNQNGEFRRLLGLRAYGSAPGHHEAFDGRRSITLLPGFAWVDAAKAAGAVKESVAAFKKFGPVHEAIPGTMITHALMTSGFGPAFEFPQSRF